MFFGKNITRAYYLLRRKSIYAQIFDPITSTYTHTHIHLLVYYARLGYFLSNTHLRSKFAYATCRDSKTIFALFPEFPYNVQYLWQRGAGIYENTTFSGFSKTRCTLYTNHTVYYYISKLLLVDIGDDVLRRIRRITFSVSNKFILHRLLKIRLKCFQRRRLLISRAVKLITYHARIRAR